MKQRFKLAIIPILMGILMVSSCEEPIRDEGGIAPVNITFKALMDGQPLLINEKYTYNGKDLRISNLKFFISDLALVKDNLEAEIKEIGLVDFTESNIDAEGAAAGVTIRDEVVPTETYDGIRFGIGVPSDLNALTPEDFSPNHPLSGGYWTNWNSYIFHKLEGRYDNDNDPSDLETPFTYHIGFDEYFRERSFGDLSIKVEEGLTTEIVIELELLDLLKDEDGMPLVLPEVGNIHSDENVGVYTNLFANNWMNAFSFQ